MKIAICIPIYNEAENLHRTIEASLRASERANLDPLILLYLDGCTDETPRLVEGKYRNDRRFLILQSSTRKGKTAAINCMAEEVRRRSKIQYVLSIDSDVEFESDAFLICLRHLETHQVICPQICPRDSSREALSRWAVLCCRVYDQLRQKAQRDGTLWFISGNFIFFERNIFLAFHPLTHQNILNEDALLGWTLHSAKVRLFYENRLIVRTDFARSVPSFVRQKIRVRRGFAQLASYGVPAITLQRALYKTAFLQILSKGDFFLLPLLSLDRLLFYLSKLPFNARPLWKRI